MINNNGGLILANKIYTAVKNKRFASYIIVGNRDIGKSTYALKVLYEVFLRLGEDPITAWKSAMGCVKFSIPDVIKYLREGTELYKKNQTKKVALVWDDLRKHATGTKYRNSPRLYDEIIGLLDTIKIPIHCFIGTCPNMTGVMKVLQSFDGFQVKIKYSTKGGRYRLAKGYLWETSPMGQRSLYTKFKDTFDCRLPNWVWHDYEVDRIKATEHSIDAVERESKGKFFQVDSEDDLSSSPSST
jgi:hypothetical protein